MVDKGTVCGEVQSGVTTQYLMLMSKQGGECTIHSSLASPVTSLALYNKIELIRIVSCCERWPKIVSK